MKIKPLFDRVVLLPQKVQKSKSSLIIPESATEKPMIGKVISVGSGTQDKKMSVSVGDTVLYNVYAGNEYQLEDTKYIIICQDDILAIIEE